MSNCLFGWPIYSDPSVTVTPTFLAGIGSWSASLPLTNLQDRRLAKVTRSSTAAVADTVFQMVLAASRTVKLFAIPDHNLSQSATLRVRGVNGNQAATSFQSVLDFSAGWSSVGTPTRSGSYFLGATGVILDLIGDDSAGALEGYTRVLGNLGTTGAGKVISVRVAGGVGGTSTSLVIRLRDTTAGQDRLLAVLNPNGNPPTPTMTTGTALTTTLVGSNEYRVTFLTANVTTANVNQLEIYPASTDALAVANTGTAVIGDVEVQDTATDQLTYDSGYVSAWPAGLQPEDIVGLNVPVVFAIPSGALSILWACEIRDSTNAAGYIELNRLVIAGGFQPTVNLMPGSGQGLEDLTTRSETDGGAALFYTRPKRRMVLGTLDEMTESEMFTSFWKMQKQLGISGQLFFMWDSADTTYKHDRSFLAVFKTLDPITMAAWPRYRAPFSLVEEI